MSVPDYQSLMLPVLQTAARGEVRIGEAVDQLADQLGLTAEERTALLPSGKQTVFSNRVHWAKTYLGKAGLIEATRRDISRSLHVDSRSSDHDQSGSITDFSASSTSSSSSERNRRTPPERTQTSPQCPRS